jgi:protein O-GlcNAc transferase
MRGAASSFAVAGLLWWTAGAADGTRRPALTSEAVTALLDEAGKARKDGAPADGLAAAEKLLRFSPREPRYLALKAEMRGLAGEFRAEAAAWEEYAAVAPFPTEACPSLGRAYERAGDAARGLEAHRRCLSWDPTKTDLKLYYGRALESAGRAGEAESLYREILAASPRYSDAALFLGRILLRRDEVAGAAALIDPVLARSPKNPDALLFGAMLERRRGKNARAKELLRRGIELSPGYADLHLVLASLLENEGDAAGAARHRALAAPR